MGLVLRPDIFQREFAIVARQFGFAAGYAFSNKKYVCSEMHSKTKISLSISLDFEFEVKIGIEIKDKK